MVKGLVTTGVVLCIWVVVFSISSIPDSESIKERRRRRTTDEARNLVWAGALFTIALILFSVAALWWGWS